MKKENISKTKLMQEIVYENKGITVVLYFDEKPTSHRGYEPTLYIYSKLGRTDVTEENDYNELLISYLSDDLREAILKGQKRASEEKITMYEKLNYSKQSHQ